MSRTPAFLSFLAVAVLASGCNLCPIPGFNNVGSIQTSYIQLDKKVPANTLTAAGEYTYLQDVNLPPGRAFMNVDYAEDSRKKKRLEFCLEAEYFRQNNLLFNTRQCARLTRSRGAEIFVNYASGLEIQQGDTVRLSFTTSKSLVKNVGLNTTLGYQLFEVPE